MNYVKAIFLIIFSINILAVVLLTLNFSLDFEALRNTSQSSELSRAFMMNDQYKFDDPFKAYRILEQLDVFSTIDPKFIKGTDFVKGVASGFKINNDYCTQHRAYFVHHPESVFEQRKVITTFWPRHKLRTQVIPSRNWTNLHPELQGRSLVKPEEMFKIDMKLDANIFYTAGLWFYKRQVGKQFSCLSQASNHIPGHDRMYRKDNVGQSLVNYAKKYQSRPGCFNYNRYFPKTWLLTDKDQCKNFFAEFLSPKYQQLKQERNIVYFRKIGADVHEGKGVFPVNDQEEVYIQKLYENGTLCGTIKKNYLIQYNIHNLLLTNNRKFGFRMFMLVASTNPVIAFYHDGYARLSLNEYDSKSNETKTFVTNIGVNIKGAQANGLTEEQVQEATTWFLEDFQNYLLQAGRISDPNWIDNYLKPEIKKVMIHLVRMAQDGLFQASSVFELYGLDFVMDDDMELWFIEANTMPLIDGFTKKSTKQLNKMLGDILEIELGLLRSRMKRVIDYVNILTEEVSEDGIVPDLEERRNEFKELSKNGFEPEFEPSPENGFERIIDETEIGINRYMGLIEKKCL